jgi:hypothetical protein
MSLWLLSVMLPVVVAISGIMWTLVVAKSEGERWCGIAVSIVDPGLTAVQAFIYIQLAWYAI